MIRTVDAETYKAMRARMHPAWGDFETLIVNVPDGTVINGVTFEGGRYVQEVKPKDKA